MPRPRRRAHPLRLSDHAPSKYTERFLGRTAHDATAEVERELGRPLAEAYDLERRTALLAALADTVEAIPHLHDALDAIDCPHLRGFQRRT